MSEDMAEISDPCTVLSKPRIPTPFLRCLPKMKLWPWGSFKSDCKKYELAVGEPVEPQIL